MSPPPAAKCGNPACPTPENTSTLLKCSRCCKETYCSKECQAASWGVHKMMCRRRNYIIRVKVAPDEIKNPAVTRVLSCPADEHFYGLHMALQTAFGWATTHSFDFAIPNPNYAPPADLFEHIQQSMAFDRNQANTASSPQEYLFRVVDPVELTQFSGIDRMHEGSRRHPNTPEKKADSYKLHQLFDSPKWQGHKIVYTYDFGDNWEHFLTIEGRADATTSFVCLEGTGHPIAEDAGSTQGWEDVKKAYRAQNPTSDQRDRRQWYEKMARNGDPRGLAGDRVNQFDKNAVNRDLANMYARFEAMADESERQAAAFAAARRR